MAVAAAITAGVAAAGAIASYAASKQQTSALKEGTQQAIESARLGAARATQVLAGAYQEQRGLLGPMLQTQFGANAALADLLGVGGYDYRTGQYGQGYVPPPGGQLQAPPPPPPAPAPQEEEFNSAAEYFTQSFNRGKREPDPSQPTQSIGSGYSNLTGVPSTQAPAIGSSSSALTAAPGTPLGNVAGQAGAAAGPGLPGAGPREPSPFERGGFGPEGFRDPNLNPRTFGAEDYRGTELGNYVANNRLAGATPEEDLAVKYAAGTGLYEGIDQDSLVQHVRGNQLSAGSLAEDERFKFTQDTAITGPNFQESPGYRFQMEEAQREIDRRNSRGGANFGGRAMLEAQRRAQGLANQDYYNYANLRLRDLGRQDVAAAAHQGREAVDVGRGDYAVGDARRREEGDRERRDVAFLNYLSRRSADFGRDEGAIRNNQELNVYDQARQDQQYENYLARLFGLYGSGAAQNLSGAAGQFGAGAANAELAGAGAASGYQYQQGVNQANVGGQAIANYNQIAQQGVGNYFAADEYLARKDAAGG